MTSFFQDVLKTAPAPADKALCGAHGKQRIGNCTGSQSIGSKFVSI